MRYVVFDVETQNMFDDIGTHDPAMLDISVVSAYDSGTDAYTTVSIHELERLWPIFEHADALVGYNSNHFDIPLLNKYYPGSLLHIQSIDLLEAIKDSFGRRVRLDSVAQATLGAGKSGNGLQAIQWWKQGEIEKIKKYCQMDVELTKRLFEYALANNKLHIKEGLKKRDIPIDTSRWQPQTNNTAMTHSLPF
ncbi:ribonuclease H-like domain-containing protein [Candidatus Kaiserbacteria bacterium]|nr:ribonuclease H-like domain-containing protein [Candidatus Kaiserbacteria bacterium]